MREIQTSMQAAIIQCRWLAAAGLGFWLLLAGPAYLVAGQNGLEGLSFAALLCLLPGWLVFFLGTLYGVANMQVAVVLFGTGLRLVFVLTGTLLIQSLRPDLGFREFIVWLIVFYLFTLVFETALVLRQQPK